MAKIDYDNLLKKLKPNQYYRGAELDALWDVEPEARKSRVNVLVGAKMLKRVGKTSNVKYRLSNIATMGKKKPITKADTHLDDLINAVSKVGTDNTVMKTALYDIKATVEKALENIK